MVSTVADLQRAPPLADQIYQRLRFQLRAGAFAPGERMVESNLAQELAVSRSPVREALNRLAADGLMETRGNGFQVAMPTAGDMAEIFEMRRLLEPPAARQVARASTPDLVSVLTEALKRTRAAERAGDFNAFTDANYAFRAAWVERVPNRRLRESILRFDDQAGFVRRSTLVLPDARADALSMVEQYFVSFRDRDEDKAAAITGHFIDAAEAYFGRVASHI